MQDPLNFNNLQSNSDQFFAQSQQSGDFDLTKAVREVLQRTGSIDLSNYDNNSNIIQSQGKAPSVQLFIQKEYWNYQLLCVQENNNFNTLEDRVIMQQFTDPKIWFTYFSNNVVDIAINYNLPV